MTDVNVSSSNITGQLSLRRPPDYINPIIFSVFMCIVMVLGVLGNLLMLITFSLKKYNTFSYSVYFRVLAVMDTIVLGLECHHVIEALEQLDPNRSQSFQTEQLYCLVTSFIDDVVRMTSASLYFVIPFDRIIICVMPFRFRKFAKPHTARVVCLLIGVVSALMNVPEIVYLSTEADFSQRIDCKIYGGDALNKFKMAKAFGFLFAISFGLTLVFNIFLLIKIKSYLKTRKTIRAKQSDKQIEARISAYFVMVTIFSILVSLPRSAFGVARRVAKTLPKNEAATIQDAHVYARESIIVIGMLNYSANYYMLFVLWKSVRDSFKSLFDCVFHACKKDT